MTTVDTSLVKALAPPRRAKEVASELERAYDVRTVGDLLRHYPRRYLEWNEAPADLRKEPLGSQVALLGQVKGMSSSYLDRGRTMTKVQVDSAGHRFELRFFGSGKRTSAGGLHVGVWAIFTATVGQYGGQRRLENPKYEVLSRDTSTEDVEGKMIPLYPSTKAVATWEISKQVRTFLDTIPIADPMPEELRQARSLLDLPTALRWIHRPESYAQVGAARKRLKWDEALAVQLSLLQRRARSEGASAVPRPRREGGILSTFDSWLPYELTAGQVAVGERIAADLAQPHPMHRLLQGEVGSGKTVVALRAMIQVVDAGGQAALLAPTEVLAAQHHRSIRELLGPLGRSGELDSHPDATAVVLVTGSQSTAARRRALDAVRSGTAGVVIGTHALLYEGVAFRDLGLVVIDEQHRFGVEQRDALRAKAGEDTPPHVLVMTATPIPRTVAMTVFGDLEASELTELPSGRSPIATHVVRAGDPRWMDRTWSRLREEVAAGHQAYVVCPRIGGDASDDDAPPTGDEDDGDARARRPTALLDVAPELQSGPLHGLRVGILHGRLPADDKDRVMRDFAAGRLDVLIATTVIEVGVDVPNATTMVILDADRFGISQLHQLRGRVGRGSAPGLCLLVTDAPEESLARERLAAVASTADGFELARLDLQLRREGDVLGEAQSGRGRHLRMLSLVEDEELIGEARVVAQELLDGDPDLARYPALAATVAGIVDEQRAEFLAKS